MQVADIYASVGIAASYFSDNINLGVLETWESMAWICGETVTSEYRLSVEL